MLSPQQQTQQRLCELIEGEYQSLLTIFQQYLFRAGLVTPETSVAGAHDLLNEVTVEALSNLTRFAEVDVPKAWLIGIGLNLIKRRVSKKMRDIQREPLIRDLYTYHEDGLSDAELFDRLMGYAQNPAKTVEADEQVQWMLSQVSTSDAEIIRLAILDEFSSEMLSQRLNIAPSSARSRLHRALRRLRQNLQTPIALEILTGETPDD